MGKCKVCEELKKWLEEQKAFQRRILEADNCVVPVEREEFRHGFVRAITVIQNKIKEQEDEN